MTLELTLQPMRIQHLRIKNFKKIRDIEITPAKNSISLIGRNGAGKTSVIEAFISAICGERFRPETMIRNGERRMDCEFDLGAIKVRIWQELGKKAKVSLEMADGSDLPGTTQDILNHLYSGHTFDPLKFRQMASKDRYDTLRQIAKINYDFADHDRKYASDYERRRKLNAAADIANARLKALPTSVTVGQRIDTAALVDEVGDVGKSNAAIDAEIARRKMLDSQLKEQRGNANHSWETAKKHREEAARLLTNAREIEDQAREIDSDIEKRVTEIKELPEIADKKEVAEVKARLEAAQAHNNLVAAAEQQAADRKKSEEEAKTAERDADRLTRIIQDREDEKKKAIEATVLPVPGLGFGVDEVLFNGVPFSEASQAESIRVGFAIGCALSPTIRIALIRNANDLDDTSRELIEQEAERAGVQVWLEYVHPEHASGHKIILEDGEIDEAATAKLAASGTAAIAAESGAL